VHGPNDSTQTLTQGMDAVHGRISAAHRELFALIAQADRTEVWRDSGARDLAHWGVHALRHLRVEGPAVDRLLPTPWKGLPLISQAFSSGELGGGQGGGAHPVRHF